MDAPPPVDQLQSAKLETGSDEFVESLVITLSLAKSPLSTEEHLIYEAGSGLCNFTVRNTCLDNIKIRSYVLLTNPDASWSSDDEDRYFNEMFEIRRNTTHTFKVELLDADDSFYLHLRFKVDGIWKTYKIIECRYKHTIDEKVPPINNIISLTLPRSKLGFPCAFHPQGDWFCETKHRVMKTATVRIVALALCETKHRKSSFCLQTLEIDHHVLGVSGFGFRSACILVLEVIYWKLGLQDMFVAGGVCNPATMFKIQR